MRISAVRGDELVGETTVGYDLERVERQLRRLGVTRCCYEAGPTGYELQRFLVGRGIACEVIAPSLTPQRPGDRVKTDKRDARNLATMHQAGLLTVVSVPGTELEAIRDLLRAREAARTDRGDARRRLGTFVLRHGRRMPTSSWTKQRRAWLGRQRFDHPAQQRAFDDYLEAVDLADRRLERLEQDVAGWANDPLLADLVGQQRCVRGIDTLSAMIIATEAGDMRRFATAQAFMSYTGLVPSEHSSGDARTQGRITRCGNQHLRRILIEAAWNNRRPPRISAALAARHAGQNPRIVQHAIRCSRRLHKRWARMTMRGKDTNKITCAVARELAGFVWAIATDNV